MLLVLSAPCAGLTLVLFRSRSRHTYGFESAAANEFELPHFELGALLDQRLRLRRVDGGDGSLCWADGVSAADLRAAATRAVLVHAVYHIVGSAASIGIAFAEAVACADRCFLAASAEVIDLSGSPNLRSGVRDELLAECGPRLLQATAEQAAAEPWVLLARGAGGAAHVGWRTAAGLAGGAGAPALGSSGRRPRRGLLGAYALKGRARSVGGRSAAMEPELAFLMASLARVQPGSVVLDPCCGSGGLLLCAAALGATATHGLDTCAAPFAGVAAEFASRGLTPPTLAVGDLLARRPEEIAPCTISAIICDPPYGMRAAAHLGEDRAAARAGAAHVDRLFASALLRLGSRGLVAGGRLVFFLPVRGAPAADEPIGAVLDALLPGGLAAGGLDLVGGRLQRFSPTFARWLCCVERAGGRRSN
jgi:hypothetical protein